MNVQKARRRLWLWTHGNVSKHEIENGLQGGGREGTNLAFDAFIFSKKMFLLWYKLSKAKGILMTTTFPFCWQCRDTEVVAEQYHQHDEL